MTTIQQGHLRDFLNRVETLEEDKKVVAAEIKDVYVEAKSAGYDVKILRKIVALRKRDRDDRLAEQEMMDLYMEALGMN